MTIIPKTLSNDSIPVRKQISYDGNVEYAEVIDVITNDYHERYKSSEDVGVAFVRRIVSDYGKHSNEAIVAKPLYPNISNYPIRFEIVILVKAPYSNAGETEQIGYYYITSVNIWNLLNHNALPYVAGLIEEEKKADSGIYGGIYKQVSRRGLNFGTTFKEKINIPKLRHYEGDVVYQGRWGNSIRFGSTVKNSKVNPPWSKNGNDGEPIIIIRATNKQSGANERIITEDVNTDSTSIYVCSNQNIPIEISKPNSADRERITQPKDYTGSQVIINSGRIVFNTTKSDIIISSSKTVNISATTINMSADKNIVFNAEKYYFGKFAKEQAVLGKKTIQIFQKLISAIQKITVAVPAPGVSSVPINQIEFASILAELNGILSNKFFLE